jgi:hypothetical protein
MKPVRYALLQLSLEPPGIDQLKRAFTSVRCLVDSDAHGLANDAFGILVRDLAAEDAHRLQSALKTEGVDTELVPMTLLPKNPPTKFVRRIELGQDSLLIFDPIGRPVPVEWRHLMLIATGTVPSDRSRGGLDATGRSGTRAWNLEPFQTGAGRSAGRDSRRETELEPLLELVLANGVARFSMALDAPALFRCLGTRQTEDLTENLRMLTGEFISRAPQAMPNRGAWFLQQSPPVLFAYPSRNAFFEEITWMLHRAGKSK